MERDSKAAAQFICPVCAKVLKSAASLRIHRRIHVDEKRHRCDRCGLRFHQKVNLKHHLNVHSNKQPYRCDLCAKGFNSPSNLKVHRKTCARKCPINEFDVIKLAPINTDAMAKLQTDNRVPFVGVFFADGSAKLYRAYNRDDFCLLRPINSEDLRRTRERGYDGIDITISTVASVQQEIFYDEYESRTISKFVVVDGAEHRRFISSE